jgi:hypothetical protein
MIALMNDALNVVGRWRKVSWHILKEGGYAGDV